MTAVEELKKRRREGKTAADDLWLPFGALAELLPSETGLQEELRRYGQFAINFRVSGTGLFVGVRAAGGSLEVLRGAYPKPDLKVELGPELASEMVARDPSGVLWQGFSTGAFRLEGDSTKLLALVSLFEEARGRMGWASLFGTTGG